MKSKGTLLHGHELEDYMTKISHISQSQTELQISNQMQMAERSTSRCYIAVDCLSPPDHGSCWASSAAGEKNPCLHLGKKGSCRQLQDMRMRLATFQKLCMKREVLSRRRSMHKIREQKNELMRNRQKGRKPKKMQVFQNKKRELTIE